MKQKGCFVIDLSPLWLEMGAVFVFQLLRDPSVSGGASLRCFVVRVTMKNERFYLKSRNGHHMNRLW